MKDNITGKEKASATYYIARRMVSNEDEYGIFVQGVLAGLEIGTEGEVQESSPEFVKDNPTIMVAIAAALTDIFLHMKTGTEITLVSMPPQAKAMRDNAVRSAFHLVKGKSKLFEVAEKSTEDEE